MARKSCKAGGGTPGGLLLGSLLVMSMPADATGIVDGPAVHRPTTGRIERWTPYVEEAAARFGIPAGWIRRVMRAESGGRTVLAGRPITSGAGAMGLMQLMPATWRDMRALHGLGADSHDPRDNILAGAAYLRAMYDRFGYPGLFAAYHAGPARYAEHLAGGRRLPAETIAYVAALGAPLPRGAPPPLQGPGGQGLFVALLAARPSTATRPSAPPVADALFVRLGPGSPEPE